MKPTKCLSPCSSSVVGAEEAWAAEEPEVYYQIRTRRRRGTEEAEAPQIRYSLHTKRFQDRAWCWVLEPLRMGYAYTRSCVDHNRRSKCHQKLPLEL